MKTKRFITLEGGEGSGKSTTAKKLKAEFQKLGYEVVITREPGGSTLGEEIRNLIMHSSLNIEEEALLFAAARVNHVNEVIIPALKANKIVICDRYVDSSMVYQYYVGNCKNVKEYNKYVFENCMPSKTFFFNIEPEKALARLANNNREQNRFDKKDINYHNKIYESYKKLAEIESKRFVTIDATLNTDEIVDSILKEVDLSC